MPQIDKGVPIPDGTNAINPFTEDLRTLSKAEVGDSIFFPVPEGVTPQKFSARMTTYISKVGTGWATQRRETKGGQGDSDSMLVEGIRVWKKAELPIPTDPEPSPAQ